MENLLIKVYDDDMGYDLIIVPRMGITERVDFICAHIPVLSFRD